MDITLALGGGGVRGFAHLGVLQVLAREGFNVRALAGTSAGGLIGALYMAGYSPDELVKRFSEMDQRSLFGHGSSEQPSLLGLSGMAEVLQEFIGERRFEDLEGPFAVTTVDVNYGQSIVLSEGRVLDAVLATIAVPGIFPAREWGEYLLVDGGIINPVPVDVAKELSPGLPAVGVILASMPREKKYLPAPNMFGPAPVLERLTRLRVAQAFNIFLRSMDISGRLLAELRLEVDKPDVVIRPDLLEIGMLDDVDVEMMAEIGRAAAERVLDELYRVVGWQSKLVKRLGLAGLLRRGQQGGES